MMDGFEDVGLSRLARGFELAVPDRPATLRRLTAADAVPFAAHMAGDLSRLGEHLPWPAATSSVDGARACTLSALARVALLGARQDLRRGTGEEQDERRTG